MEVNIPAAFVAVISMLWIETKYQMDTFHAPMTATQAQG